MDTFAIDNLILNISYTEKNNFHETNFNLCYDIFRFLGALFLHRN